MSETLPALIVGWQYLRGLGGKELPLILDYSRWPLQTVPEESFEARGLLLLFGGGFVVFVLFCCFFSSFPSAAFSIARAAGPDSFPTFAGRLLRR